MKSRFNTEQELTYHAKNYLGAGNLSMANRLVSRLDGTGENNKQLEILRTTLEVLRTGEYETPTNNTHRDQSDKFTETGSPAPYNDPVLETVRGAMISIRTRDMKLRGLFGRQAREVAFQNGMDVLVNYEKDRTPSDQVEATGANSTKNVRTLDYLKSGRDVYLPGTQISFLKRLDGRNPASTRVHPRDVPDYPED